MEPRRPGLVEKAGGNDPEAALYAIIGLRQLANVLERRQVAAARVQGWTWDQIAHILGVIRQVVSKRHGQVIGANS
jgi:hypothetical protein